MALPVSLTNDVPQNLDTLYDDAGDAGLKLGIGEVTGGSITPKLKAQGVATHVDGDTFSGERTHVIVLAGVEGTTVRKVLVDADGNLISVTKPSSGVVTDGSDTITAGGTEQTALAANLARRYLLVQNPSAETEPLWLEFGAAAVADSPSIEISPGGGFVMEAGFVSTQAIHVIAATTGHKFTVKEG